MVPLGSNGLKTNEERKTQSVAVDTMRKSCGQLTLINSFVGCYFFIFS